MDKLAALKQHFGHSEFRPGQEALIDALLAGRDALGVMPTGAGKSVCYQIPALLLPGVALVVSPLISLMKDQVAALSESGISAAFINSSLTDAQYKEVFRRAEAGRYKLIYVAPERLLTRDFLSFADNRRVSLVAVDEAHCVCGRGKGKALRRGVSRGDPHRARPAGRIILHHIWNKSPDPSSKPCCA